MSWFKVCVFSAVLCSLVVLGQGDVVTEKPVTMLVPKLSSTTTTTSATTTSTTTSTTTETPTTSTTTETSTTTTTETPTTTSTTSTSTTTETPTTLPPKPTPTPAPTPPPAPTMGKWLYEEKNVTCIVVQFAAQLNVTYTKENSTIAHLLLNVPSNASVVGGSCAGNNGSQWLALSWPASNDTNNLMTLVFQRNDTTHNYALKSLNVTLSMQMFPNASVASRTVDLWHGAEWMTPLATSYRCAAPSALNMTADGDSVIGSLTLSQLQEEAFRTAQGTSFSAARECGGGDVPDAVPIAVGCALGGLVVVVLVAYLVARRRSAARGYLSM